MDKIHYKSQVLEALSELQGGDKQKAISVLREVVADMERVEQSYFADMEDSVNRDKWEDEHGNHDVLHLNPACPFCEDIRENIEVSQI